MAGDRIGRRKTAGWALALALAAALSIGGQALAAGPPALWQVPQAGPASGAGAAQIYRPGGVATSPLSGDVYLGDRKNGRIDQFNAWGQYIRSFGWNVDASAPAEEPQSCDEAGGCQEGTEGGGAGQLNEPNGLAFDSTGDLYVSEQINHRIQKFDPEGNFLLTFGGGVVIGGATGTGNLSSGSTTVSAVTTSAKAFEAGQTITGAGIPAETRITAVGAGTITLSKAATAAGSGVALTVAEGTGNLPTNEQQTVSLTGAPTGGSFTLTFKVANPSPSEATSAAIAFNASAAEVQGALQALANIGAGNVEVSGPAGGPWSVEFKGARFADTNVNQISGSGAALTPSGGVSVATAVQGASGGEVCTVAADCKAGIAGTSSDGQFSSWSISALVAVGPGDQIYVGDEDRIQVFDQGGAYQSEIPLPKEGEVSGGAPGGKGKTQSIAIDSAGALYFDFDQDYTKGGNEPERPNIYKRAGGTWSLFAATAFPKALAVDQAGNLYAVDVPVASNGNKGPERIVAFEPDGSKLIPSASEDEEREAREQAEEEAGKTPSKEQYFGQREGFEIPGITTSNACGQAAGSPDVFASYWNFSPPKSLLAAFGPPPDPEAPGCPLPPEAAPDISEQFASEVGEDGASVRAKINSRFWPTTTYYVEYGTEPCSAGGCESTPAPPGEELESKSNLAVLSKPVFLGALAPATTYHYRFVARTEFEGGGEATVKGVGGKVGEEGAEGTFTTAPAALPAKSDCPNQAYRGDLAGALADCRAYEMVSPVDKEGADIVALLDTPGFRAGLFQSATSGNRMTYSAYRAYEQDVASAPYSSQYIASRVAGVGWSSEAINPGLGEPLLKIGFLSETPFKAFSEDLCQAWLRLDYEAEPGLDPAAPAGLPNLYRRDNCGGGYEAVTRVAPATGTPATNYQQLDLQGTVAGGSIAAYAVQAQLGGEGPACGTSCPTQLYLQEAGGAMRFACRLPDGSAASGACFAGTGVAIPLGGRRNNSANALAADGARLYFTTGGDLYLRTNPTEAQSAIEAGKCSEAAKACTTLVAAGGQYWSAATDGSRAIYTSGRSQAGGLFEYEAAKAKTTQIAAAGTVGVMGASENAKALYFASAAALGAANAEGKEAQAGEPNLYFREAGGSPQFIGTLAEEDIDAPQARTISSEPIFRASRVAPDGAHAAFISRAPLTGFDNTDAVSGEADTEVFHYSAAGGGALACVSCDPSGARPSGRISPDKPWQGIPAAAWIPTWESEHYGSRALSEDGSRLFFNSHTPLLARDTNGRQDVYEWRAGNSAADCQAQGAERFLGAGKGCLSLISTGQSPQDSEFLDASPAGADVFFATGRSLVSQDPGLIDVYDAREGGGLPEPPGPPAECEGQACQSPAPAPPALTPGSLTYSGPGDLKPAPACGKSRHRAKGKCVKNKKKHKCKARSKKAAKHKCKSRSKKKGKHKNKNKNKGKRAKGAAKRGGGR